VTGSAIHAWREAQRQRSDFRCDPVPLSELPAWRLDEGEIAHHTGGFFRIVGVHTQSDHKGIDGNMQPFILQPEIGILGILAKPGADGPQILVQAKTEPGNVGAVQLAPSFQCTPSNYTQRHGGERAPFLDFFANPTGARVISDLCQSEQGTRFLGKFNRNMVVEIAPGAAPEAGGAWRWVPAFELLQLVQAQNVLNTDARSVLVSTPWGYFSHGAPFARWRGTGGFGEQLLLSYTAGEDRAEHATNDLLAWIAQRRRDTSVANTRVALASLPGWQSDGTAIQPRGTGSFAVRGFRVRARDREVPEWDQPLVDSAGCGLVALLCQRRAGVLHLLMRAKAEPGLGNTIEFTAAVQIPPGEIAASEPEAALAALAAGASGAVVHLRCEQSEEGGRFFQDRNDYVVAEIPDSLPIDDDEELRWVTLAQLETLCTRPGLVTNEARSAASLLLAMA
jgi:dTDP-4-dehydro-6-deoxy-alpha-D-glucopyranose 2,3-dehydratase